MSSSSTRRSLLIGLSAAIAAPAIVRAASLMPVRAPALLRPALGLQQFEAYLLTRIAEAYALPWTGAAAEYAAVEQSRLHARLLELWRGRTFHELAIRSSVLSDGSLTCQFDAA